MKEKLIPTRSLGKIIAFLFLAYLDENDILRISWSEDELEENLDSALMQEIVFKRVLYAHWIIKIVLLLTFYWASNKDMCFFSQ